jgi:hypothetical protein
MIVPVLKNEIDPESERFPNIRLPRQGGQNFLHEQKNW